jgi:hypothetical protein
MDWISHQTLPFPNAARVRHYRAEFSGPSGTLTPLDGTGDPISVGGIDHYLYNGSPLLWVQNQVLTIVVPPSGEDLAQSDDSQEQGGPTCSGFDYPWHEGLGNHDSFEVCGTWRASLDDPTQVVGTIDGAFAYYQWAGPGNGLTTDLFCRAKDHQFTLTKR